MPSLERRRERDFRAGRFESEVRGTELLAKGFEAKRKFMCSGCRSMFEEKSRSCPRCETKTMGELKPIPERHREEAQRNALRRAQARARGGA